MAFVSKISIIFPSFRRNNIILCIIQGVIIFSDVVCLRLVLPNITISLEMTTLGYFSLYLNVFSIAESQFFYVSSLSFGIDFKFSLFDV